MRTQQCARCKTQVDWPEGETRIAKYGPAAGQRVHVDYEVCLAALNARAEAAEAKTIETLENSLLALGVDPNGIDEIYMEQTAKGVINAILERIADLEAQLAALKAGEWRPVSERPDSSACLYEVTVRASWDGDVFMTHGNLYMPHDGPDILRWRPAPPQE